MIYFLLGYHDLMTWYVNWRVNSNRFNMLSSQCLLKNLLLNIYFKSNYVFTCHSGYLLICQDDWLILDRFSNDLNFFPLEKTLIIPKYFFYIKKIDSTYNVAWAKTITKNIQNCMLVYQSFMLLLNYLLSFVLI